MAKEKENITILAIGDRADYDSFKKLHRERKYILDSGFDYRTINYQKLFAGKIKPITTKKVIVFLFFPFNFWNKEIEYKGYKGKYGNRTFFTKFSCFWKRVEKALKIHLKGKDVFFVNNPSLAGFYRDKRNVEKRFIRFSIPKPKRYNLTKAKCIKGLIEKGHNLFIKPRYGSMGKGITYLSWSNWQTNFLYKKGKIISRISDKGWKFRDITGEYDFLRRLILQDMVVEQEINSLLVKNMKIDLRIYAFFNKVAYIYPRRNRADRITTNITQGAKGDPGILKKLPQKLITKSKNLAEKVSRALGLNFVGMDIMIDQNMRDLYVIDVNVFSGFPKIKTFNLASYMIDGLRKLCKCNKIPFGKGQSFK